MSLFNCTMYVTVPLISIYVGFFQVLWFPATLRKHTNRLINLLWNWPQWVCICLIVIPTKKRSQALHSTENNFPIPYNMSTLVLSMAQWNSYFIFYWILSPEILLYLQKRHTVSISVNLKDSSLPTETITATHVDKMFFRYMVIFKTTAMTNVPKLNENIWIIIIIYVF